MRCYICITHWVSGFLVEGMETDQFVDINEDVALHWHFGKLIASHELYVRHCAVSADV